MEDASRLIFIGIGVLVVGLIIGYSIGRYSGKNFDQMRIYFNDQKQVTSAAVFPK